MERAGATGLILHVQRLSTEDGPGIRSTVFMKQCPLSCRWCHNPESVSARPEIQWFAARCIGCRSCAVACARHCITPTSAGLSLDRAACRGCGECVEACPAGALELLGRRVSAEALVGELARDRAYFEPSGGGVTLSGGEPLSQPAFTAALLAGLRARGIGTAVDTCGLAPRESVERVLPGADLVLFDLKVMDPEAHRALTGVENGRILENLEALAGLARAGGAPRIWIRTPLIPGATATGERVREIGAWIAEHMDGAVDRWELCAFNNLCRDKYQRLGIPWEYAAAPLLGREELEALGAAARSSGVDPARVGVTGSAREEMT
jgi:pyruvate formate lyase activating enzyme